MLAKALAYLRSLGANEPAVVAWALNGGLAALAAFVLHYSKTQEAAAATIVTALAAIFTAWKAKPRDISIITGALATMATAAAAFGLHLAPGTVAAGVTVISALLGLIFRTNVTPVAALRQAAPKKAPAAG